MMTNTKPSVTTSVTVILLFLSTYLLTPETVDAQNYVYKLPATCKILKADVDLPLPPSAVAGCTTGTQKAGHHAHAHVRQARQVYDPAVYVNQWPKNNKNQTIIPYVISPSYTACRRDLILEAMKHINKKTSDCIKFVARKTEKDYIYINASTTVCQGETAGRKYGGGIQQVYLDQGGPPGTPGNCFYSQADQRQYGIGTIVHELGHVIGFFHEFQRKDRDDYITVNLDNVAAGMEVQFDIPDQQVVYGAYDYFSIMHYRNYTFAKKSGLATMVSKTKAGENFGQSDFLTDTDVAKFRKHCSCP